MRLPVGRTLRLRWGEVLVVAGTEGAADNVRRRPGLKSALLSGDLAATDCTEAGTFQRVLSIRAE